MGDNIIPPLNPPAVSLPTTTIPADSTDIDHPADSTKNDDTPVELY